MCWSARGAAPATLVRSPGTPLLFPGTPPQDGKPVWYGGGKLAADLTLPKLRRRWEAPGSSANDPFTAAERSAVWEHAARVADDASARIQMLAATDPAEAADAAWAVADTLHVAAAALGSRILRQAADAYDRAARAPYGRLPAPTPAGDRLRRAARLLSAYGYITSDPSFRPIVLITRLAALVEAVALLRQAQERAAQAASARSAAERLHAAGQAYAAQLGSGGSQRVRAALAGAGFPVLRGPIPGGCPCPRAYGTWRCAATGITQTYVATE